MNFIQKLPRWALSILLLAYIALGWYVGQSTAAWQSWLQAGFCRDLDRQIETICLGLAHPLAPWGAVSIGIFALVLALVHPITKVKSVFGNWLQSDTKAFLSVIALSFVVVVVLTRSDLLAEGIVALLPGLLARLELRLAGYSDWQSFGIILMVCLIGYASGLTLFEKYGIGAIAELP